ncbi:hypothetical protein SDC9_204000 [bioreactor metagenome]|uniref:Uncharacterized protein n=1 Tax=bioreactor metagenome TaxID=1076179 RepID=A0A645IZL6_9ZZZZ
MLYNYPSIGRAVGVQPLIDHGVSAQAQRAVGARPLIVTDRDQCDIHDLQRVVSACQDMAGRSRNQKVKRKAAADFKGAAFRRAQQRAGGGNIDSIVCFVISKPVIGRHFGKGTGKRRQAL